MRILFLSQRVPYPPDRGDKITTWRLVERMRREHEVTCVVFAHGEADRRAAQELRRMGVPTRTVPFDERRARLRALPWLLTKKPLTCAVYGSRRLQAEVDLLAPRSDLAYAYSSSMGAFLLPHSGLPRVMHFAELDSDKWRQYAERTRPPMRWVYAREARTLLELERRLAHELDDNVFCTPLEQAIFQRTIPGARSRVLRNGVDLELFAPAPERAEPGHVVFTGVMSYFPNADGARVFATEVFPTLRREFPHARFSIVGAHPSAAVRRLGELEGVLVTGTVPDTREYLARASVAVAPLRIARGIQNKVLEAMAMGLPVVGTTPATQGVEGRPGRDFLVADSSAEQIEAVRGLFARPDEARELGRRARAFVEERYDWEVVLLELDRLLAERAPASALPTAERGA